MRLRCLILKTTFLAWLLSLILSVPSVCQAQPENITAKITYRGKSYVGKPLAWDGEDLALLRRDGRVSRLPMKSTDELEKLSDSYEPYSFTILANRLRREFGGKYQVTQTQNFLVVHPPGNASSWSKPFQDLYWRFELYFKSRGLKVNKPKFPMIAVVLKTRKEFDYFLKNYQSYDSKILGYYSATSNRIITYDQSSNGNGRSPDWLANNSTLIHEATHQTAFNTGIHNRFAPEPRWISEGMAMMFEAPGVNNSAYYSKLSDRINADRLRSLKQFYRRGETKNLLAELIVKDDRFRTDPNLAYAYAWGLSFYLSEKMPNKYLAFLRRDASRQPYSSYSAKQRAQDFAKAFGSDVAGIEARMKEFITGLKSK